MEPAQQIDADEHKRTENKRLTAATGPKVVTDENQKIGGDFKLQKNPAFIAERKVIFDELYATQQAQYKGKCDCGII